MTLSNDEINSLGPGRACRRVPKPSRQRHAGLRDRDAANNHDPRARTLKKLLWNLTMKRPAFAGLLAVLVVALGLSVVPQSAQAQSTAPTVTAVAITSNPGADNTYGQAETITVSVTFSEAVTVTGTPRVTLDIGGQPRYASYTQAGTATGQILFGYTVLVGDQDPDGISVVANSLALNGGTIRATDDSANATLTHAASSFATHKVDSVVMLVSNLGQASASPITISATQGHQVAVYVPDRTRDFRLDEITLNVRTPSDTLNVKVRAAEVAAGHLLYPKYTYSGSVAEAGLQTFTLSSGQVGNFDEDRGAISGYYVGLLIYGEGTGRVELEATLEAQHDGGSQEGWVIRDLLLSDIGSFDVPKLRLRGYSAFAPYLEYVDVISSPSDGTAYRAGERIEFLATFYRKVGFSEDPSLTFWLGNAAEHRREASYVGKTDAIHDALVFAYTVQAGDTDTDGIYLAANSLGDNAAAEIHLKGHGDVPAVVSAAAKQYGATQAVDGSRSKTCKEILCTTMSLATWNSMSSTDATSIGHEYWHNTRWVPYRIHGSKNSSTFDYDGGSYAVTDMYYDDDSTFLTSAPWDHLFLYFDRGLSEETIDRLALLVDGTVFLLDQPDLAGFHGFLWVNEELTWMVGTDVEWKLIETATATFDAATYTHTEGDSFDVTVTLSGAFKSTLTLPVTVTAKGGVSTDDYSGIPDNLVFAPGETEKTFNVTLVDDTFDDDDESLTLSLAEIHIKSGGTNETATVNITDNDDPEVTVQFGQDSQGVGEGETVNVTINLSADPERTVTIPVTSSPQGTASTSDYSVPTSVTFNSGDREKTIAFMAVDDTDDDDDEKVKLGFGTTLPTRVTLGTRTETTLNIGDDDDPEVKVQFGASTYTVAESDDTTTSNKAEDQVVVTVKLDKDPERTIIIPIKSTLVGTASAADYSGVPPSVTFNSGDTSKTFTFSATPDLIDDDGEGVKLTFGTMPDPRVSAGTTKETTVSITDDDTAEVVLHPTSLALTGERLLGSSYTVALATEPTVAVTVTVTGHSGTDLTLAGAKLRGDSLTFTPDNWNRPQTVRVTAVHDEDGVNDEETLTHTAAGGEYASVNKALAVIVTDNDPLGITIDPLELTVDESASADYTVKLDTEPTVAVTVTVTGHSGTDLTLSGSSVTNDALTFTAANWRTPQTVTVSAAHDEDLDDDMVTLTHTGAGGEYAGITGALAVTVLDNTGNLRLVDGTMTDEDGTPCEGRLEIYYNGKWGTICDDNWYKSAANIACRQLGFFGGAVDDYGRFINSYFPPGTSDQAIVLDSLRCQGYESNLLECPSRTHQPFVQPLVHNCRHFEDVGLRCIRNSEGAHVVNMEISAPPGDDGTYDVGDEVEITLVFSEPVHVELNVPPDPLPSYCCHDGPPRVWLSTPVTSGHTTSLVPSRLHMPITPGAAGPTAWCSSTRFPNTTVISPSPG